MKNREYGTRNRPQRYTRQIVVMVTPEVGKRIDAIARQAEISVGQAVRDLIADSLTQFEPERVTA